MNKPNILYIHSHDTGRYIQPFGHAVPTPNMQKLAENGVLFRQNFCVNPTCSPSRASLLTGSYPHENGMIGLAHRGFSLNDYNQHLVHTLRQAGYHAALAGVQHVAANQDDKEAWQIIGYDQYLGDASTAHKRATEFLAEPPQQPFFLSVGFFETHREFPPIEESPDDPTYCLPPSPFPDTPETRLDMARYKASARILDTKMGQVFDALEQNGLAENTLVICTTDHGIPFPRMKCNLHDSGIGVLLIMRGPGGFNGRQVIDAMTTHLDIYPTICDLLSVPRPSWLRGKSLLPLVNGGTDIIHDTIFAEVNFHAAYEPMRAVRTKRWKYIKRFDGRTQPVLPNCDEGECKSFWLEHGWADLKPPAEMLFDLIFDPYESNNLIHSPGHQPILKEIRQKLFDWMQETDDPLLTGPIPAPYGSQINDADGLSPGEPAMTVI